MLKAIRALGELALRCNDIAKMRAFYEDVVGLELYNDDDPAFLVFLKIGEAVDGHPQILGLFDRKVEVGQPNTTLDHFAFIIDVTDYEAEEARLRSHGVNVVRREFPRFNWRSLFFSDPEGNTVELVAYDATVQSSP